MSAAADLRYYAHTDQQRFQAHLAIAKGYQWHGNVLYAEQELDEMMQYLSHSGRNRWEYHVLRAWVASKIAQTLDAPSRAYKLDYVRDQALRALFARPAKLEPGDQMMAKLLDSVSKRLRQRRIERITSYLTAR